MVADPWTKHDFMTRPEREYFKRMRDSGAITFYRTSPCEQCGAEVLKGKRFCSEKCKDDFEKETEDEDNASE